MSWFVWLLIVGFLGVPLIYCIIQIIRGIKSKINAQVQLEESAEKTVNIMNSNISSKKLWLLLLTVLMVGCFCFSFTACQQGNNHAQGGGQIQEGGTSGDNSDEPTVCVHSDIETVTQPTCLEQGYTTHTCIKCGNSYKDNYTIGEHTGVGTCLKCGDNFYLTLATYMASHADYYASLDAYVITQSYDTSGYEFFFRIQLNGDGELSLNAVIFPPAVDGTITPITFSMDMSEIDGSYDWNYSNQGKMNGIIYSATLANDTDSLLYLTTDISFSSEISFAQQMSALCAKALIGLLADVAIAADECLTLDNFGFVSYSYTPTEYVP